MSKKLVGVAALAALCALSMFLVNCGSSSSRPAGLLYVLTQGTNGVGNYVNSYSIDLNTGNLSFINANASTCNSTTSTCGPPLDIVLDPTGATAFVLNQGVPCPEIGSPGSYTCDPNQPAPIPPTIYPYNINSDGSFGTAQTPVAWSCGSNSAGCTNSDLPQSIVRDAAGQFLFAINQGSSPAPGYPSPTATSPSCPHSPASQIDVCPSISVFSMTPGSTTLSLAAGSPFYISKVPTSASVVTYTPQGGTPEELLFVTSNFDVCSSACTPYPNNDNTLSVYSVSSTGALTELPGSPYTTSTDPLVVQAVNTSSDISSGGVFIYVGSQPNASGALNIFQLCTTTGVNGCSASDVQNQVLVTVNAKTPAPGQNPVAMLVDPTNTFIYIACQGSNQVFGYKIGSDGSLSTLTPTTSEPTGTKPVSMAMHASVNSSGAFLYTSNNSSASISGFSLSTTTGSMSDPITVNAYASPTGMAAK